MIIALIDLVAKPGLISLLGVLLVFGFAPVFVLRLVVMLYPANDPRRAELVAELYVQGRVERLLWVSEQVATAVIEGPRERFRAWRTGGAEARQSPVYHRDLREHALRVGGGNTGIYVQGVNPVNQKYINEALVDSMIATGYTHFIINNNGEWQPRKKL